MCISWPSPSSLVVEISSSISSGFLNFPEPSTKTDLPAILVLAFYYYYYWLVDDEVDVEDKVERGPTPSLVPLPAKAENYYKKRVKQSNI